MKRINMSIPNLVAGNLPGFDSIVTAMMEQTVKSKGVASIKELRDMCIEADVKLVASQITMYLFNFRQDEFIPEIADWIADIHTN